MQKIALVTGATSGLGKAAAEALAQKGYKILIAGRDTERGQEIAKNLGAEFIQADLFSVKGIQALANTVKQKAPQLSLLINNAGGSFQKKIVVDGLERTFSLNTLAPFLLSQALLPELSAAKGRIVNVATGVPKGTTVKLEELSNPTKFSGLSAYSNAKLALIALSIEMAQRFASQQVSVVSLHPGIILGTRFGQEVPRFIMKIMGVVARIFRMNSSLEQAIQRFMRASLDDIPSGSFIDQDKLGEAPAQTQNPSFRSQLWDLCSQFA